MAKISVVMTTYNGKDFIVPQLESLKNQTRTPDEVLIFDDQSKDATPNLVQNFIHENNLSWSLVINADQLGWRKNFMQGFQKASGDIIFPCDQDDIWNYHKIEDMVKILEERPAIKLLVSNYSILYDPSYNGKKTQPKFINDMAVVRLGVLEVKNISRPGCVYSFRKNFLKEIQPYWEEDFAHDAWIWRCAVLEQSAYLYRYSLIEFRRHQSNSSPHFKRNRESKLLRYEKNERIFAKIHEYCKTHNKQKFSIRYAYQFEQFYHVRKVHLQSYQFRNIVTMIRYIRFYRSFKEFLGDLLLRFSIFEKV